MHDRRESNPRVPNAKYIPSARVGSGMLRLWSGMLHLGQGCFTLGPRGFLDANMLVFPTRISRVEGLDQRKAPMQRGSRCSGIWALDIFVYYLILLCKYFLSKSILFDLISEYFQSPTYLFTLLQVRSLPRLDVEIKLYSRDYYRR